MPTKLAEDNSRGLVESVIVGHLRAEPVLDHLRSRLEESRWVPACAKKGPRTLTVA